MFNNTPISFPKDLSLPHESMSPSLVKKEKKIGKCEKKLMC